MQQIKVGVWVAMVRLFTGENRMFLVTAESEADARKSVKAEVQKIPARRGSRPHPRRFAILSLYRSSLDLPE